MTDSHDPRCYQSTGVPQDLPAGLCDCKVLRMLDTPPAEDAGSEGMEECGAASEHERMAKVEHLRRCPICDLKFATAEALAESLYHSPDLNLPLSDSLDIDCHDVARAVLASDWLVTARAEAAEAATVKARQEGAVEALSCTRR